MISVSAKIPIKPHAHPETQAGWPISASRPAAKTHWEMTWTLQSVLGLRDLCLGTPVFPTALNHQGFPLVIFGFPILSLWELVIGVLCMHTPLLISRRTTDSTLSLNISTLRPWQWLQELLSFLLRFLLIFALVFSFYLPTLYQSIFIFFPDPVQINFTTDLSHDF